ncbi:CPBP family intramembrane glutamic endopeptidase [Gemmatimonadota bacterium]
MVRARSGGPIRWGRVLLFLLLVFSLTWGSMGLSALLSEGRGGVDPGLPPLGMYVPALVALVFRRFFLQDSLLFFRAYRETPRWIIYGFFGLVGAQVGLTLLAYLSDLPLAALRSASNWAMILWTLLLIRLYKKYGGQSFRRAGLQLGNTNLGAVFVAAFALYLALQSGLNLAFGLSTLTPPVDRILGFTVPGSLYPLALLLLFLLSAVGTPLGSLPLVFGEEYAWRGFLQDELEALGRLPASLFIGLIWGLWHIPVILSGIHTYPPTLTGIALGLVFFSLWGVVQSYAVFKVGSVWAAAFLHGVVNGVYAFFRTYVESPDDKVFSFGLGLYGILCLALVALLILRDPVWRREGGG